MSDLTPYDAGALAPLDGGAIAPATPQTYTDVPAVSDRHMASPYGTEDHAVQPYQPGHQAFGVPLPAGVSPARMQAEFAVIADVFLHDMAKLNIPANFATIAADWFLHSASMPPPREPVRHSYRVNLSAFSASDRAYANQFLGLMAHAGAPQGVIDRMLGWYFKLLDRLGATHTPTTKRSHITDPDMEAVEARSAQDARDCEAHLRGIWGNSFESNLAIVANHVVNMRADLREHLERAVYPDGKLGLNDPNVIIFLLHEALGGTPSNVAEEIERIETVMRQDPRRYFRDESMQRRLRHLYSLRGH